VLVDEVPHVVSPRLGLSLGDADDLLAQV
jgi:hypothetical protein